MKLPIDGILPELLEHFEHQRSAILSATPGSGKTTRVPPALLRASFCGDKKEIWVLEPRRLAAKYAAHRVAQEMGQTVGESVGYHFRFEKVSGPKTRLHFLTEGMLIRKLISNPRLDQVAAVVLDEFHERHLHGDSALAYLARLQANERPDLRILVMSATLDAEAISGFLGNCSIFRVENQVFPISIHHTPAPPAKSLEITVRDTVFQALREDRAQYPGDILVFLPGMSEIRRAQTAIEDKLLETYSDLSKAPWILPLHGDLTRQEQDRAIQKADRTKVILSTNVAETSLTIEGLNTVIDSGLHRIASFSWWSGVPSLRTRPISRASSIQRAGRAGRTAPGRCYRLYTQGDFSSRPAFEVPEIQRADLCQTILELKSLGVMDLNSFAWFEAPAQRSLQSAQELLYLLGAIDQPEGHSSLTALGKRMVQAPAHPRISRMLIEAERRGVLETAATLAALLSEGQLDRSASQHAVTDPLDFLDQAKRDPFVRRTQTHFLNAFQNPLSAHSKVSDSADPLRFSVLAGFPDRIARKKKLSSSTSRSSARDGTPMVELLFSSGGSALVSETGVVAEHDTFVTLDIQEQQTLHQTRSQLKVKAVCAIEPDWLFDLKPSMIQEKEEAMWDSERERIKSVSKMTYGELVLIEEENPRPQTQEAARILLKGALGVEFLKASEMKISDWVSALSKVTDPALIRNTFGKMALIAQHMPQLLPKEAQDSGNWPAFLAKTILSLLEGKTRLLDLKEIDWENGLLCGVFDDKLAQIHSLLPTHVTLNPKRRALIHYELDQPPWIESRLQDFFGLKRGPSLFQGKLPITLHLLAPNQRALQVTTDLTGFWERTYPELRNALSRRYPRHAWPENPLELLKTSD